MSHVIQHVDSWKKMLCSRHFIFIFLMFFLHGRFMHADDAQPILDLLTQILGAEFFLFWEVSGGKTTPALLQTNSFHLTHSGRKMSFLLGPGLFSGAKWLLVSWSVTGFSSITFWSFWGKSQGINASESDQKDVPIISHWLTLRGSNGLRLRVSPNGGLAEWQMVAAFFLQFQMLDDDWW